MKKRIIIASDGNVTRAFIDGKVYGKHINALNFYHEGGEDPEVQIEVNADYLPVEGDSAKVEEFRKFLRNLQGIDTFTEIKEAVKEAFESDKVTLEEKEYVNGEHTVTVSLNGKELYRAVGGMDKAIRVEDAVDTTIRAICEKINKQEVSKLYYVDTVRALAALVEARAKLF